MSLFAYLVDGEWRPAVGVLTLTRMVDRRIVTYHDGRQVEEECPPYPVEFVLDIGKVAGLVAEGTWQLADAEAFGLRLAVPFVVPDGKRTIGAPRIVEVEGELREDYDLEDLPPPPSAEEKLAASGLTIAEMRQLLGLDE